MTAQRLALIESDVDRLGVREAYEAMVAEGTSPAMAHMLACQQFPGLKGTDSVFNANEHNRMASMHERERESIVKLARQAGINTTGKYYNGQLGKYDDPAAWVSGTHDVKQAAMAKGYKVSGDVNYSPPEMPKKEGPRIAKDILDRLEKENRKRDPSLDAKCKANPEQRKRLRDELVERHAPKKRG